MSSLRLRFVWLLSLALCASFPAHAAEMPPAFPCGTCITFDANAQPVVVPLESTEVVLDIRPGFLEAEVIQTFTNRTGTALEATYLYPLPDGATITAFELRYPDHVVHSEVREKAAAQAAYDNAKAEGRKAALLTQRDPSLFSTAVANFLPGETVHVVIRLVQPLMLTADHVDVRFPMVTSDKYFPADFAPGTPGNAAPNTPRRNPADLVTPNHVYAFDIQVSGFPVSAITSPSHRIRVESASRAAGEVRRVSLTEEIAIPDRDFVLRIDTQGAAQAQPTVVMQHAKTGDYGLLTIFPPQTQQMKKAVRARDVLFLVDRSGSMQGARIQSARLGLERCLGMLAPQDRFQIVLFDNRFEFYRPTWQNAFGAELEAGLDFVRTIPVRGGTEMQPALSASLAAFERNEREQLIIFLTDGDVGNANSLLNLVETQIGQVRLFTFGIGDAPNATLLTKMAEIGHGAGAVYCKR